MIPKLTAFVLIWFWILLIFESLVYGGTEVGSDSSLRFQLEPEGTVVAVGSSAVLHCRPLLDSLLPHVRWRFNSVSLSQSTHRELLANGSLLLHNVRSIDQGNYQCQVALPSGGFLLSKLAFLQLAELEVDPSVTPVSLTLLLGQTARLPCGVQGRPSPTVHWLRNGFKLQLDETRLLQLPGQQLEIQALELDDQAEYTCQGSNSAGSVKGPTHRIRVSVDIDEASQPTVPQFAVKPRDTVTQQGQEVTLHCAANGYPQPTVIWLKDGNTIDMSFLDRRFYLIGTSSLQIIDVQPSDAGNYQCRAVNAVDSVDSSALLTVHVPPVLVSVPSNTEAVEQQDVKLVCAAQGTPQPSIVWTKDGELLHQSKYFRITERKLRILGLVSRDSGVYQCFATNTAGSVQAAARLTVLPAAPSNSTMNSADKLQVLNSGSTVSPPGLVPSAPRNITARVVGPRFAALTWRPPASLAHLVSGYTVMYRQVGSERLRVQNVTVPEEGSPSLQVQDLLPNTQYSFRLAALSSSGHGQASGPLLLRTAPEPASSAAPQQLHVTAVGSTRLLVGWQAVVPAPLVYTVSLEPVTGGRQLLINTTETSHLVARLQKYTQYRVRVSAVSQGRPVASSVHVLARTWSDVPSAPPQNVTVETISDTSVEVHWLPPAVDRCHGPLTGYKLLYRLSSSSPLASDSGLSRRSHSVVTDASRHSYRLSRLLQQAEYQVKVAALTINGTGPFTRWLRAHTYQRQQVELSVPGRPGSLRARPTATSITVLWTPPADRTVRVRGYTLGWGRGVPDLHAVVVPDDQYHYMIRKLVPGAEYVLSLRALNAAGNGTPVYETLWTRSAADGDNGGDRVEQYAMTLPTGLKVDSVSESAMVLHWSDLSLPSQEALDDRVYRVRYNKAGDTTFRYFNSSNTNCMIDGLQPDTLYEFAVQTIVDATVSGWSMLQTNRTREAAPGSPPRDVTAVPSDHDPTVVSVNWQPPKLPNGKIHGYLVQYSEDHQLPSSQWHVQSVPGASLTATLQSLRPSVPYWVRVQARNAVGSGPMSRPIKLVTEIGAAAEGATGSLNNNGTFSDSLLYVVVSCGVTAVLLVAAICSVCLYKRKSAGSDTSRRGSKNGYIKGQQPSTLGGCSSPDLKPPDLWIHHCDQMELGGLSGTRRSGSCSSIARRSSRSDIDAVLPDARSYLGSTLDRRRLAPVTVGGGALGCPSPPASTVTAGSYLSDDFSDSTFHRHSAFRPSMSCIEARSPRPLHALVSTSTLTGACVETRPIYPHSQFTIARGGALIEPPPPAPCVPVESHYGAGLGMISASSSEAGAPAGYLSGPSVAPLSGAGYSSSVASSSDSSCLHQRLLEQHGVTATLAAAAAAAGVSSFGIHPAVSAPVSAACGQSSAVLAGSPLRRPPAFACAPLSTCDAMHEELMPLRPAYSTEELTQEMANLEGLMKDLSVITASEFQC